ncbi:MAG: hypothetical protein OEQ16_15990 [Gammaproteobacteria bacterium]|nr:hypothetical protein [Gammaproteobacteria bacterium]
MLIVHEQDGFANIDVFERHATGIAGSTINGNALDPMFGEYFRGLAK